MCSNDSIAALPIRGCRSTECCSDEGLNIRWPLDLPAAEIAPRHQRRRPGPYSRDTVHSCRGTATNRAGLEPDRRCSGEQAPLHVQDRNRNRPIDAAARAIECIPANPAPPELDVPVNPRTTMGNEACWMRRLQPWDRTDASVANR